MQYKYVCYISKQYGPKAHNVLHVNNIYIYRERERETTHTIRENIKR